jgi:hypothetical protein
MQILMSLFAGVCFMPALFGQERIYPPPKPSPARIEDQIMLLNESVLKQQWTHTLDPVNAPRNTTLLNPGQCVRIAVVATGDNRDQYLRDTNLSFNVRFAGHTVPHDHALMSYFKRMKPEGGDFVTSALAAGGVKAPDAIRSMASLGISASNWCVPTDAHDGSASVTATIELPGGKRVFGSSTVEVETFATGSQKKFKDVQEFGQFLQTYYQQPNPARLLPAIEFMVAEEAQHPREGQAEIVGAFLSSALKADAAGGHDLLSRIGSEPALVRAFGLLVLRSAGYEIGTVLSVLPTEEQARFQGLPALEDPFDLTPSEGLFHRLDMLWGVFGATGLYEPVNTIASALAWRSDYEAFAKMRNGTDRPSLTPSIVRGVVYTAAGWSLRSFQMNDGLVADYIEYMLASEETRPTVKSELRSLSTNPAFKGPGRQ